MKLLAKAKLLAQFALRPIRGETHAERLESFYHYQAEQYDSYRESFLIGRSELIERLELQPGTNWLDVGCGTGYLLELAGERGRACERIVLADVTPSLIRVARRRVVSGGWTNVEVVEQDAMELKFANSFDVVTFSYALTMIPDWFAAIQRAIDLLKPDGHIAVADFYVARKFASETKQHTWVTRNFWPAWFDTDNVRPSSDHLPYLKSKFETIWQNETRTVVPGLPFFRPPCYQFIGAKRICLGA